MTDIFGSNAAILEGHEAGLIMAGAWVVLSFLIYAGMRQFDRWMEKRKEIRDPYIDDNNLGSH